jgi:hypothetical protein
MAQATGSIPNQAAERWARYGICLLVVYAVARAVVAAHARPLWYDEIFTWAMAHQPGVGAIWGALLRGVDSQGLLFYLVERAAASLPCAEIGFRLPSILGFACTMVCVYVFVQWRSGSLYGLISAASLLLTALFIPDQPVAIPCAIDARAYSLAVACISVALVAYQRAAALRWVAAMALALGLAVSFHYYSVFAIVPFAAAEAIHSRQISRVRWPLWIGFAVGFSPLVIFWPHLAVLRSTLSAGFWAKPSLGVARDAYGQFLSVSNFWGFAVFVACAVGLLQISWPSRLTVSRQSVRGFLPFSTWRGERQDELTGAPFHERALAFFLLATPFTMFVATRISHGGYFFHYILYSILGFALAAGFILPRLGRRALLLASILLVGALAIQEASFWLSSRHPIWRLQPPAATAASVLSQAGHADLPIFMENPHGFLQLAYYAPPPLTSRLVFIADGPSALRYGNSNTDDVVLPLLAKCYPINVVDFQSFRSLHPAFLLYSAIPSPQDWWLDRLVNDGFSFQLVSSQRDAFTFLVTAPKANKP